MEFIALLNVIRRRWWLILIPTVIAAALALPALPEMLRPRITYSSVIRFTASHPVPEGSTFEEQAYLSWLSSEYAVTNLATWIRTGSFIAEMADVLAQGGAKDRLADPAALAGSVTADSARSILTMYISWDNPDETVRIAEAAAEVLQSRDERYFPLVGDENLQFAQLDPITVAPVPPQLAARIAPLFRILIGLVAGIGLAFLVDYLDPAIRERREIESLGYRVVGEIPRH
jgi:capsular polysaccharide biosynthesis protein